MSPLRDAQATRATLGPLDRRLMGFGAERFQTHGGKQVLILAKPPFVGGLAIYGDQYLPFTLFVGNNGRALWANPGYLLGYTATEREYDVIDPDFFDGPLSASSQDNAVAIGSAAFHLWIEIKVGSSQSPSGMQSMVSARARMTADEPPPDEEGTNYFSVPWAYFGAVESGDRTVTLHLNNHHEFRYLPSDGVEGVGESPEPPPWVNGFQDDPPPEGWCPIGEAPAWNYTTHLWACVPVIVLPSGPADSGGDASGNASGNASAGDSVVDSDTHSTPDSGSGPHDADSSLNGSADSMSSGSSGSDDDSLRYDSSLTTSKMAIVPDGTGSFVRLHCSESPDPWFIDIVQVQFDDAGLAVVTLPESLLSATVPGTGRILAFHTPGEICYEASTTRRPTVVGVLCILRPTKSRAWATVMVGGLRSDLSEEHRVSAQEVSPEEFWANDRFYRLQGDADALRRLDALDRPRA